MHAEFIGAAGCRLFALLRGPEVPTGDCTLVVPPFAEEMNKCRRLVTDYAHQARRQGRGTLCVDLAGTGDSEGGFAEARVERWLDDLEAAIAWSATRGWRVTSILGIRLGALLAAALVRRGVRDISNLVFWQPVTSGARMIDQFLRIRIMATRLEQGRAETAAGLRAQLRAGEVVEVAGYPLSGALCADIEALDLRSQWFAGFPPIRWLEVVADTDTPTSPATQQALDQARAAGCRVDHSRVAGEPFWMATEVVTNPALVASS
jgi:exosortase A-associated hydrolase 2